MMSSVKGSSPLESTIIIRLTQPMGYVHVDLTYKGKNAGTLKVHYEKKEKKEKKE